MAHAPETSQARIETIVWLDPPLLIRRDLAGVSVDVTIGGRATILTVPQEGPETYNSYASPPERAMPSFPPPPLAEPRPPKMFATAGHAAVTPTDALVVEAIRLRWRDQAVATSLKDQRSFATSDHSKAIGVWLATVIDWLAAWYGQARDRGYWDPIPPVGMVLVDDPDEQAFYADGGAIPSLRGGVIVDRCELVAHSPRRREERGRRSSIS